MNLRFLTYGMFVCSALLCQSCAPFSLKALTTSEVPSAAVKQIVRAEPPELNHHDAPPLDRGGFYEKTPRLQLYEITITEETLPNPSYRLSAAGLDAPLVATVALEATKVLPANRIETKTNPRQAISVRLLEQGKKLLANREYRKALRLLEKALGFDSTNPQIHYHLAKVHYFLGHHSQAQNFLDIAESLNPKLKSESRTIANSVDIRNIDQLQNR